MCVREREKEEEEGEEQEQEQEGEEYEFGEEEEGETAEINDDNHVASPAGCSGTGKGTGISTQNAEPDSRGRAMAREGMGPAARHGNTRDDGLEATR